MKRMTGPALCAGCCMPGFSLRSNSCSCSDLKSNIKEIITLLKLNIRNYFCVGRIMKQKCQECRKQRSSRLWGAKTQLWWIWSKLLFSLWCTCAVFNLQEFWILFWTHKVVQKFIHLVFFIMFSSKPKLTCSFVL